MGNWGLTCAAMAGLTTARKNITIILYQSFLNQYLYSDSNFENYKYERILGCTHILASNRTQSPTPTWVWAHVTVLNFVLVCS